MGRNIIRSLCIFTVFITITYFFVQTIYSTKKPTVEHIKANIPSHPPMQSSSSKTSKEKFMSYFPHGDFASQHEAVRVALRIALETKRTLILPQLRLGTHSGWEPFLILQKRYEEEDKQKLSEECKTSKSDLCNTLNDWIEVPWSTFYDLRTIEKKFHIRIRERKQSHTWGIHDPLVQNLEPSDVVAIDPNSFPSNGSDWDPILSKADKKANFFAKWFQKQLTEEEKSMSIKAPLTKIMKPDRLTSIKERYIQFGSLVHGLRFQTSVSKAQNDLHKALTTDIFISPNRLQLTNEVAKKIIAAMGGRKAFSVLHFNFEHLARSELENRRSFTLAEAAIRGTKVHVPDVPEKDLSGKELVQKLSPAQQTELMTALVREIYGDMPINQAVASGLEYESSTLKTLLSSNKNMVSFEERGKLLSACIDYKSMVNKGYPVNFLFNDVYEDIVNHKELFGPLLDAFPCTFTINDLYEFGVIDSQWSNQFKFAKERKINYEKMLLPIVEVLVGSSGYSFFEAPVTKLTRLIAWN